MAVFYPGIRIPYYADDFQFVFDESSPKPFYHYFYNNIPENNFYRPLQAAYLTFVQGKFGLNTTPVHVVQILIHVLFSWLLYTVILRLGFTKTQAVVGSLFFLLSQANAHAVLSNDTLSQTGGTFFGCLAVWSVYLYHNGSGRRAGGETARRRRYYYAGLAALVLSYLSKESSIFFVVMVLAVFFFWSRENERPTRLATILRRIAPFLVLTIVYLLVRSMVAEAQPGFGAEKYDFRVGANVIKNMGMFLFAGTIPASSVDAFVALKSGALVRFLAMAGLTALFLVLVAVGLYASRKAYRIILLCAAFALVGMFPMVLMNHVSELYVYNVMPFISLLVGVGLGKCLEMSKRRPAVRVFLTAAVCAIFVANAGAVRGKASMMQACGERASALLEQIEPHAVKVPAGGKLLLVNPPDEKIEYSVFLANGFNVLENGLHRIYAMTGRKDYEIKIVEVSGVERERTGTGAGCLAVSLADDGTVRVYD